MAKETGTQTDISISFNNSLYKERQVKGKIFYLVFVIYKNNILVCKHFRQTAGNIIQVVSEYNAIDKKGK